MHLHIHEIEVTHAAGEATLRVTRPLARVLVAAIAALREGDTRAFVVAFQPTHYHVVQGETSYMLTYTWAEQRGHGFYACSQRLDLCMSPEQFSDLAADLTEIVRGRV